MTFVVPSSESDSVVHKARAGLDAVECVAGVVAETHAGIGFIGENHAGCSAEEISLDDHLDRVEFRHSPEESFTGQWWVLEDDGTDRSADDRGECREVRPLRR